MASMKPIVIDCYEELDDSTHYVVKNWLRQELTPEEEKELRAINGAATYLFAHYIVLDEDSGGLTSYLAQQMGKDFNAGSLSNRALDIRTRMSDKAFMDKKTELVKYMEFLQESEEYVLDGLNDEPGRLALAYIEAVMAWFREKRKDLPPLQAEEVFFLQLVSSFYRIYKGHYQAAFPELRSEPFFSGVEEASARIRAEIID